MKIQGQKILYIYIWIWFYIYYVTNGNKQTEQQIEMVRIILSNMSNVIKVSKLWKTKGKHMCHHVSSTATHQASPATHQLILILISIESPHLQSCLMSFWQHLTNQFRFLEETTLTSNSHSPSGRRKRARTKWHRRSLPRGGKETDNETSVAIVSVGLHLQTKEVSGSKFNRMATVSHWQWQWNTYMAKANKTCLLMC